MRTYLQLAQRAATLHREVALLVARLRAIGTATTPVQRRSQTMMLRTLRRHEAELASMAAGDRSSASRHAARRMPAAG